MVSRSALAGLMLFTGAPFGFSTLVSRKAVVADETAREAPTGAIVEISWNSAFAVMRKKKSIIKNWRNARGMSPDTGRFAEKRETIPECFLFPSFANAIF